MKNKIIYIAEFSLPNMSAYAVHVLKMCDSFSNDNKVELILPFSNKSYNFKKIRDDYLLKNNFKIKPMFNSKVKLNLFYRALFSLKISNYLKINKYDMIIARAIIPSLILSILNHKNILELHSEITGLSKYLFKLINIKKINNNLKFILLNSKLIKILKIKSKKICILEDAVEINDFTKQDLKKKLLKCAYSGSFGKGKGLETIYAIANRAPKIEFHIFGNKKTLDESLLKKNVPKNIKFMGFFNYKTICKTLTKYKILLMPYQKKVGVLIKKVDVSKYFSPLKLFEYMASGRIIIASDLKVYKGILKDRHNSIILDPKKINKWVEMINAILKSEKYNYLGKNAKKDVEKYSWNNRAQRIVAFNKA